MFGRRAQWKDIGEERAAKKRLRGMKSWPAGTGEAWSECYRRHETR